MHQISLWVAKNKPRLANQSVLEKTCKKKKKKVEENRGLSKEETEKEGRDSPPGI
jgi:hypothetical protein